MKSRRFIWGIGVLFSLMVFAVAITVMFPGSAAGQLPSKTAITPPRLVSFQINNGAPYTPHLRVILNNHVQGDVNQYRASRKSDFSDPEGAWKPYSNAPAFEIPSGLAHVDIFFQVRYADRSLAGRLREYLSSRLSDGIDVRLGPQDYTVPAGTARAFAMNHGWTFRCTIGTPLTERCYIENAGGPLILQTLGQPRDWYGAKSDFLLFAGRELNSGWTFKSLYFSKVSCSANNKDNTVEQFPSAGSRNITIRIHMWTNAGDTCEITLGDMVLTGPPGKTWEDAFI
jgi:hypothetical protein